MKGRSTIVALVVAMGLGAGTALAQDAFRPYEGRTQKLASKVGSAVVALAQKRGFRPTSVAEALDAQAGGAGFIIDEQGHVLTCASLVPNTGTVELTLRGHGRATAKVIAKDPRTLVALLKLDDAARLAEALGGKIPHLGLGSSKDLKRGRVVATLGNPYGSVATDGVPAFSIGAVSALGRIRDADRYKGFGIETDAAVNPGSFGGPLVDLEGNVVGVVVEAISTKRWLGIAVPIDEVAAILPDLKAGRTPPAPYLGIGIEGGEPTSKGVVIASVDAQGPAGRAGLKAGDRLLTLDGAKVTEAFDVERELGLLSQGTPVELAIERAGKRVVLVATLGAGQLETVAVRKNKAPTVANKAPLAEVPQLAPAPGKPWVGMNVEEKDGGIFVKTVVEGGPADKAKLQVGDRLVAFAGKAVKSKQDILEVLGGLEPGQKIALRIEREGWMKNLDLVVGEKGAPAKPKDDEKPETKPEKKPGKSKTAFLGVAVDEPDGQNPGLHVNVVAEGSPAEKAGIKKDDFVLEIGGAKITDIESFMTAVKSRKPGDVVKVRLAREGWEKTVTVTLGERPSQLDEGHGEQAEPKAWIGVAAVERDGKVVIDEVADAGPAAQAKLKKGDAILEVVLENEKRVKVATLDDLEKLITSRKSGDRMMVVVERDGWSKTVTLTLGDKPADKD